MVKNKSINSFKQGFKDGLPISLGYVSVSFTFGMMAVNSGLPVWMAVLISLTTLTSAGQFAGLELIVIGAPAIEMALTQLVINLRYALMSLSVSQKADKNFTLPHRFLTSFGITDEIYAVVAAQPTDISPRYMYGLISLPYIGWGLGTFLGAAVSTILPETIATALNIAIYGMFIAIFIPPAKHSSAVLKVILISVTISVLLTYLPGLNQISSGFAIIVCAVVASVIGAILFPVKEEDEDHDSSSEQQ